MTQAKKKRTPKSKIPGTPKHTRVKPVVALPETVTEVSTEVGQDDTPPSEWQLQPPLDCQE